MADRLDTFILWMRVETGARMVTLDASERAAFLARVTAIVHAHRAHLVRVARGEGLAAEDAFDAVQEALHGFITRPEATALVGEAEGSRKLLVSLTRNIARNRRRLHAVARPHDGSDATIDALAADVASVEALLVEAEEHVRLAGCMRTLDELPRAVVTLRMLDDQPGEDVARALGISPGHVAVTLYRAKASLRACMTSCPGG